MKIAISYPPILNQDGQKAMVSQNRNVQFFKTPTYLLPVVRGQAATWLKQLGYDVYWDDGNAQLKTYAKWFADLVREKPDVVVFESTTPVMHFYWRTINEVKRALPRSIVIMTGYHSMRMPEETLQNSAADVILKSNHIDFSLKRLIPYIDQNLDWRSSCNLEGFTIRVDENLIRDTGSFRQIESLDLSPDVDRDLVQWKNYAFENGNYLQTPGTYATSVIRDCTFGKCTFCRYNGPDLTFTMRSVEKSLDEYHRLIEDYGVKEIFDDSGVWYRGAEARRFAKGIMDRGLHKRGVYFGMNTRFAYLDEETLRLLGKANFRFVLIGMEAADRETLSRLNKGYIPEDVDQNLRMMTKAGLFPHLTIMVGYYWQTKAQLDETVKTVKRYMFSGLARTLQVTLCTPIDFTPYHRECIEKGVMLTDNYNDFDMSKLIVKTEIPHDEHYRALKEMYLIALHPKFVARQLLYLLTFQKKNWQFLFRYGFRAIRRVRNHIYNLTKNAGQPAQSALGKPASSLTNGLTNE